MISPRCRWGFVWAVVACSVLPTEPYGISTSANRWRTIPIRHRTFEAPTRTTWRHTTKASTLLLLSSKTLTESNATVDWHPDDASRHKVVVLEDVVTRMQAQKIQLVSELDKSQSAVEDLETTLRTIAAREGEVDTAQLKEQRIKLVELEDQLEAVKEAKQKTQQKTKQELDMAREKAIEQHKQLHAKVEKLQRRLSLALAKLDDYRKESFERESLLRKKLEIEREAKDKLQSLASTATEELEKSKSEIVQQKKLINETLTISNAAVAAGDRRESTLKHELKKANEEIAKLRANHAANVLVKADEKSKELSAMVKHLQEQIESMENTFESDRQVERQKWGKEIEALQEALEIARGSCRESRAALSIQTGKGRPSILQRIGRKLRL